MTGYLPRACLVPVLLVSPAFAAAAPQTPPPRVEVGLETSDSRDLGVRVAWRFLDDAILDVGYARERTTRSSFGPPAVVRGRLVSVSLSAPIREFDSGMLFVTIGVRDRRATGTFQAAPGVSFRASERWLIGGTGGEWWPLSHLALGASVEVRLLGSAAKADARLMLRASTPIGHYTRKGAP